jgi:hypothetical protein
MRMYRTLFAALALLVCGLSAAAAQAQRCTAPPGTAAVDQYCETIPAADGSTGSQPGNDAARGSVSKGTLEALRAAGADGSSLAGIVSQTAPAPATGSPQRADAPKPSAKRPAGKDTTDRPSANPLTALSSAAGDGSILPSGLVWVLLALLVTAVGIALFRRRSNDTDG